MQEFSEKEQSSHTNQDAASVLLHPYIVADELGRMTAKNKMIILDLISSGKADIHSKDATEQTPLQYLMNTYLQYLNYNWIQNAIFLISCGADPNTKDKSGRSLLHHLVHVDGTTGWKINDYYKENIALLIKKYNADINLPDNTDQTPLRSLVSQPYYYPEDVFFLITYGADPNDGCYLLHKLIIRSQQGMHPISKEAITRLITVHQVSIDFPNDNNQTLLQSLINQSGWLTQDALYLVALGADPNTRDAYGRSLLHRLISSSEQGIADHNKEAFMILTMRHKAKIDIQDGQHRTPLQALIDQSTFKPEDALFLVQCGADPNSTNLKNETLLYLLTKDESTFSFFYSLSDSGNKTDIIFELIVNYDANIDQQTLLDTNRRHMIAKKLYEALLDPAIENKGKISAALQKLRLDFKFESSQDSKNKEKEKETGINSIFPFFHFPSKEAIDITLDYYINSLLIIECNRTESAILQYVAMMVGLAEINPESFATLLVDELTFLIEKDTQGLARRVPYLKALISDPQIYSFYYFDKCLRAINTALTVIGQPKIEIQKPTDPTIPSEELEQEMRDLSVNNAPNTEKEPAQGATTLSQIASSFATGISSRMPVLPSPSKLLNAFSYRGQQVPSDQKEKEGSEVKDQQSSFNSDEDESISVINQK